MRYYKNKKALLVFKDKKHYWFREKKIYGLEYSVIDKNKIEYQLFTQDKIEYFTGYRVTNPKIGILVEKNIFVPLTTYENFIKNQIEYVKLIKSKNIKHQYNEMKKDLILKEGES